METEIKNSVHLFILDKIIATNSYLPRVINMLQLDLNITKQEATDIITEYIELGYYTLSPPHIFPSM